MDERTPPTVGIVACLAVLVAIVGPFFALPPQATAGLGPYYRSGLAGGWGVGLLALVALVAFAGGRQRRTDPETVAGATLVVGVATLLVSVEWALAVNPEVVQTVGTATWLGVHRWVVVACSAVVPVAAAWYARTLGVL